MHEAPFGIIITPNEYHATTPIHFTLELLNGLKLYRVSANGGTITQYDFNATNIQIQTVGNPNSAFDINYTITDEGYMDSYYAL